MSPRVVVVGLGPGNPRLASAAALEAISRSSVRFLRTGRHPSAHLVPGASTFDEVYERAADIDSVYATIVDALAEAASSEGEVLYAVPGSPLVAERTVELLRADPRVEVVLVPSLSFVDLAWERLGVDPFEAGVRLVDGHRFAVAAAGQPGPFLVAQCDSQRVLSSVKLAVDLGPDVTVMQRLGTSDEAVFEVPWADLDRSFTPDHLTCAWIPRLAAPVASEMVRFGELVRVLRAECPWDRSQTHRSLARHLVEETYEVLDAIDGLSAGDGEGYAHLEEELGDLLFQVGFHAALAAEAGQFELADVARGIHDKLVARHPHVFGPPGTPVPDWEQQKRAEKGRSSVMEGVPGHLPSLLYAYKMQSKAASVGFDWQNAEQAWPKIDEELQELAAAVARPAAVAHEAPAAGDAFEELGDVLFSVVNVARHLGLDPESALRSSARKFRERFLAMEELAAVRGVPISDELWDEVKARRGE